MMNFDFDEKAFTRFLNKPQKEVLPKAAAGFLNGIAFEAQKKLKAHVPEAFDGFVKFTERAFIVKKADARSTNIVAEVSALPAQAAYLKFQIDGGARAKGDAGAGHFDLSFLVQKSIELEISKTATQNSCLLNIKKNGLNVDHCASNAILPESLVRMSASLRFSCK